MRIPRFGTRDLLLVIVILALVLALFVQHRRAMVAQVEAERTRYELLDQEEMLQERLTEVDNERAWLREELESVEMELRDLGSEWNRDPYGPRTRPMDESEWQDTAAESGSR